MNKIHKSLNILIVDDSLFFCQSLKMHLEKNLNINSIEVYNNSLKAYRRLKEVLPDIIILDVEMPNLSGIDFLKKVGMNFPVPIIVVSSLASKSLEALEFGALEFVVKPNTANPKSFSHFIDKMLEIISGIGSNKLTLHTKYVPNTSVKRMLDTFNNNKFIAIGASTGGTEAILSIIKGLPQNSNGIVVAMHMPEQSTNIYAERINSECDMTVKEANNLDKIENGVVLIAKGGHHMTIHKDFKGHYVKILKTKRINGHMPSIDVMFNSISKLENSKCMGIILTGMGDDGANGLLAMKKSGFYTVGQSEKNCTVYGMPLVAKKIGAVSKEININDMSSNIIDYMNKKR